jgi:hypothetical protein
VEDVSHALIDHQELPVLGVVFLRRAEFPREEGEGLPNRLWYQQMWHAREVSRVLGFDLWFVSSWGFVTPAVRPLGMRVPRSAPVPRLLLGIEGKMLPLVG